MSNIAMQGGATGTGTVTLLAPSTSTNRTINLPDSNGTILTTATAGVPVNGPAFSAYYAGASQSITTGTFTKVLFDTELFDTNSNFASSRFTPTIAGYYQINSTLNIAGTITRFIISLYKNGGEYVRGLDLPVSASAIKISASSLIYLNGSSDYVEVYVYLTGTGLAVGADSTTTQFSGAMIRSAT